MRGAWVAQSVKHPMLAQVMISWFTSLSPVSGSVLTARSLKPASDSVSPSLSAPPPLALCLSLSIINKHQKKSYFKVISTLNVGFELKTLKSHAPPTEPARCPSFVLFSFFFHTNVIFLFQDPTLHLGVMSPWFPSFCDSSSVRIPSWSWHFCQVRVS